MKDNYDCIVVGGGPAGSTTAALLAEAGCSTLLVEREKTPRCRVGESLMPETFRVLQQLGVWEQVKNCGFTKKASIHFLSGDGRDSQSFFFQEHDPNEGAVTWQVERARFDQLLFENAVAKGAHCLDQTSATDVLLNGDRASGVVVQTKEGLSSTLGCRVLVDASGPHGLLARRLELSLPEVQPRQAAIWGYYRGARRDAGEQGGGVVILQTCAKDAWFWFIPLSDDVTSIGVVGDAARLLQKPGQAAEAFEDELVKCPALIERLMNAELATNFHVARGFAYATRRRVGEGWVLVGDAYGTLEPVFSSGVFLAMHSGARAAEAILTGLAKHDLSAKQLGAWTTEFDRGVDRLRPLLKAFHTAEFSFGAFTRAFPHHKGALTNLLMGRLFDADADPMLEDLAAHLKTLEEARSAPPAPLQDAPFSAT